MIFSKPILDCFVSSEKICDPPGKNRKKSQHVVYNIKKYFRKMSLVFSEISKNCQNHGVFEGAVMGRCKNPTTLF